MRLYELEGKYRLYQKDGKWYINDLELPAGEAEKIRNHVSNLHGTVNRFDLQARIHDYLGSAYAVIGHPSNKDYLDY